jgi:hypothetical protein
MPKLTTSYIKRIDSELVVTQITQRTTAWIEEWSEELGRLMKLTTHREIENLLTMHLRDGKSVADLARAFMESGTREEYYRARTASLTEMLRAHSVAQQEAIIQNPAVDIKEWVHTGSYRNNPRENHVKISGDKARKDQPFSLTGADGNLYFPMYPRDICLPPSESINCHCIHRGIANEDVLGLSYEERLKLQEEAIAADDREWERERDAENKARAGITENDLTNTNNYDTMYSGTGEKGDNGILVTNEIELRQALVDFKNHIEGMEEPYKSMYQYYADNTVLVEDPKRAVYVGYDPQRDVLVYNKRQLNYIANQQPGNVIFSHELAHRYDNNITQSWNNENFTSAIKNAESAYLADPEKYKQLYAANTDLNPAFQDILSAISRDELNTHYGHDASYWNDRHISTDTFANLSYLRSHKIEIPKFDGLLDGVVQAYEQMIERGVL